MLFRLAPPMMFVLLYIVIANVVFVQYSVSGIWVGGLLLVVSGIIMYMCIGNGSSVCFHICAC